MTRKLAPDIGGQGAEQDLTGSNRLARNVLASWSAHVVFVVAGFLLPRMIDSHIGQVSLGIWDFCWSLVNYFGIAGLGIGTAVNRFVAKHRAAGDIGELRRTISSVAVIQAVVGVVLVLASAGLYVALPLFFADHVGSQVEESRAVVALLGLAMAAQMALDSFRGVITGCHRWDIHNGINAGSYAVAVVGMIAALVLGGGLLSLALVYFACTLVAELVRAVVAYRVCPELSIRWLYADWAHGKEVLLFGGKGILLGLPPFLVTQSINVSVAATLGPAALATFSRPLGLVRHIETFVNKFSFILTPVAGALHGDGRVDEVGQLAIESARWGVAMTLPPALGLAILGDALVEIWMGADYVIPGLLPLLALGMFPVIGQSSVLRVVMGMDLHGRIGLAALVTTAAIFGVGVMANNIVGWTLHGAAALAVASIGIPFGVVVPYYACRRLGIQFAGYLLRAFTVPVLCGVAFSLPLAASRHLLQGSPLLTLVVGCLTGGLVLAGAYWRWLFSEENRVRVRDAVLPGRA